MKLSENEGFINKFSLGFISSRLISWQYFCHHLRERGTNMLYLCQIEQVLHQRTLSSEVS